jgi:23S rRNA pseudouridine1911/1915/1917 synthase
MLDRMARPVPRLELLHEERDLVVVNKPAGLLTIPSAPGRSAFEDTVLSRAQAYARHKRGPRAYVGVLHRLDRDTTGALAIALSRDVHARGRALFGAHRFERRYVALVHGVPVPPAGSITGRISSEYHGRRRVVSGGEPGLEAVTQYRVIESLGDAALVEVRLETGRQHQIRIHLEFIGHPIVGDAVYTDGATSTVRAPRVMLHARTLEFPHPVRNTPVRVEAPLPRDFETLLTRLRRLAKGHEKGPGPFSKKR